MHQDLNRSQAVDMGTQVQQIQFELKKLQQTIAGQAKEAEAFHQDVNSKFVQIASRLSEKKSNDQKIQELIERHNQIMKTFEVRLVHFQALLTEKERLLAQAKSDLNTAKMEIARHLRESAAR